MKSLILSALLLVSACAFGQKDSTKSVDTVKPKQYVLVLTEADIAQLFSLVRTSGRYSGAELEAYIQAIMAKLTPLEPPKKSSK